MRAALIFRNFARLPIHHSDSDNAHSHIARSRARGEALSYVTNAKRAPHWEAPVVHQNVSYDQLRRPCMRDSRRSSSRYNHTSVTIRPKAPYHSIRFGAPIRTA